MDLALIDNCLVPHAGFTAGRDNRTCAILAVADDNGGRGRVGGAHARDGLLRRQQQVARQLLGGGGLAVPGRRLFGALLELEGGGEPGMN